MGYAFISYSTKNQESADFIRNIFKKNGIETWMAPYNIPAGSKYAAVITKAIRDCSCFVLLLSNASQESVAVDSEVELAALTFKKTLITIELEKVALNDAFTFYIHNKQIIPLYNIYENSYELQQILSAVRRYTVNETETVSSVDDNKAAVISSADNKKADVPTEKLAETRKLYMIARDLLSKNGIGLRSDGTLLTSGKASYGELALSGWSDIAKFYPGKNFTVGLKNDGTVVATGFTSFRQKNLCELSGIKEVSTGAEHIMLLFDNGTVTGLGRNNENQCDTSEWRYVKKIISGHYHSVGLRENGTVVACGWNDCGQCNVSDWTDIVEIQAGREHTFGLRADGTVLVAGNDRIDHAEIRSWKNVCEMFFSSSLAIGIKTDGTLCSTGTAPDFLKNILHWQDIVQLSASGKHCVGLTCYGTVVCSGDMTSGECKVSDWHDIITVFAGDGFTLGLKKDGTVVVAANDENKHSKMREWKLFDNIYELENERKEKTAVKNIEIAKGHRLLKSNYTVDELMKIRERNELVNDKVSVYYASSFGINNGHKLFYAGKLPKDCDISEQLWNNNAVAKGKSHIVLLKTDGTVFATGENRYNQCEVSDWRNIVAIDAEERHTLGLRSDGTVVAAGKNKDAFGYYIGECDVSSWEDVKSIHATEFSSAGLKNDGTVLYAGEKSDNIYEDITKWHDIRKLVIPHIHSIFIGLKTDGTVVATGSNAFGMREITKMKNVYDIATTGSHVAGVTNDGYAFAAGINADGQCNVSGWTDIVQISAGHYHTVGLKADGTVVAAGSNSHGQCNVSEWRDIVGVHAILYQTIGIKADGTLVATGNNDNDQLNVSGWKLFNSIKEEETKLELAKGIFNDLFGNTPIPEAPEEAPVPSVSEADKKELLYKERRKNGLCQHCGGSFSGLFTKKCSSCGMKKDY